MEENGSRRLTLLRPFWPTLGAIWRAALLNGGRANQIGGPRLWWRRRMPAALWAMRLSRSSLPAGWLAGLLAGQPGAGRDKTKGSLLVAAAPAAKTLKDKRPAISR